MPECQMKDNIRSGVNDDIFNDGQFQSRRLAQGKTSPYGQLPGELVEFLEVTLLVEGGVTVKLQLKSKPGPGLPTEAEVDQSGEVAALVREQIAVSCQQATTAAIQNQSTGLCLPALFGTQPERQIGTAAAGEPLVTAGRKFQAGAQGQGTLVVAILPGLPAGPQAEIANIRGARLSGEAVTAEFGVAVVDAVLGRFVTPP